LLDVSGAAIRPGGLDAASVGDRDRLVAALHARCFGDRVESHTRCTACQRAFEIGFSLEEEIATLTRRAREAAQREPVEGPDDEGFYRLPGGALFRLPTVADERRLLAAPAEARAGVLLELCVRTAGDRADIDMDVDVDAVERAMAARDPGVNLALDVPCALCGAPQSFDLDIVQFFLATIARERPLLTREIHSIATAYRWSFHEIVELSRRQRHEHVELIEAEREVMGTAP
jgi:hypothetical protein